MMQFDRNLDRYVTEPDKPKLVKRREEIMIELALKGQITLDDVANHDLMEHGVLHIEDWKNVKGPCRYSPLEPLMCWALHGYLEKRGVSFDVEVAKWMRGIAIKLPADEADKGFPAEVLLASVLSEVAKDLRKAGGKRPLTSHSLFEQFRGTFLDHYTLEATKWQHDTARKKAWRSLLLRSNSKLTLLPYNQMRPDLLTLLRCLPDNDSRRRWGEHCIPLTAGVKVKRTPKQNELHEAYRDNFLSTDLWAAFTEGGHVSEGAQADHSALQPLLQRAFGDRKRAVRISFTYRPANDAISYNALTSEQEQLHLVFDFRNQAFRSYLERWSKEASGHLASFTGQH
jgi:hypothetical protein